MSREIKFKIKAQLNKKGRAFHGIQKGLFINSKVHNVESADFSNHSSVIIDESGKSVETIFTAHCEVYQLLQYTGLKDKNGVDIYEGDICKVTYYNHTMPDTVIIQNVVYVEGGFALMSEKCTADQVIEDDRNFVPLYYSQRPNKIEVIGSIHSNPELIK